MRGFELVWKLRDSKFNCRPDAKAVQMSSSCTECQLDSVR